MHQLKMKTLVKTLEKNEEFGVLTPEEQAYWNASIERDLRNKAEGKPQEYLSSEEFWNKFEEAVMRHYEGVQN